MPGLPSLTCIKLTGQLFEPRVQILLIPLTMSAVKPQDVLIQVQLVTQRTVRISYKETDSHYGLLKAQHFLND